MINSKYIFPLLSLTCFLLGSIAGWGDLGYAYDHRKWYYILQAVAWLPLVYSIHFYNKKDILHQRTLVAFTWMVLSNIADELFFDPLHIGANEIAFFILVIIHEFFIPHRYGS